jgi:hypothetical protein
MKNIIVILACLLVAPLAFGQSNSKHKTHKRQTTVALETAAEPITVTGAYIIATEEDSAASYQPPRTLVVNKDSPGTYVLDGPGHVLNNNGEVIRTAIKPGAHVRVYYATIGSLRMVDHVVVE